MHQSFLLGPSLEQQAAEVGACHSCAHFETLLALSEIACLAVHALEYNIPAHQTP